MWLLFRRADKSERDLNTSRGGPALSGCTVADVFGSFVAVGGRWVLEPAWSWLFGAAKGIGGFMSWLLSWGRAVLELVVVVAALPTGWFCTGV